MIESMTSLALRATRSERRPGDRLSHDPGGRWPRKVDLFGIQVSVTDCEEASAAIIDAAQRHESAIISAFSVHALVEAATDPGLKDKVNRFAMIVPDGQPVRWALNWLYAAGLAHNVRGSDLMWQLCRRGIRGRFNLLVWQHRRNAASAAGQSAARFSENQNRR